jgi:hypothetical protein
VSTKTWPLWKLAALGFGAMCAQDLLATVMVVAEAQGGSAHSLHAALRLAGRAGLFDAAQWLMTLVCTALAVGAVLEDGWRKPRSLVIIGSITLANFVGTMLGVTIAWAITGPH